LDPIITVTQTVTCNLAGGRAAVSHLIYDAVLKGTIKPIQKFHLQRKENKDTKQIKAAFTLPHLIKAAQHVATVIANKPPAQMPIFQGLVNETATKTTSAMERCIKSLKDKLKATVGKTPNGAKKSKGDGKKSLQRILKKKGTPAAPKKTSAPRTPRDAQDAYSKGSACVKGKKKPKGRKVLFDGKKVAKPTNSRK
jgi:hypothetical protein